MLSHSLCLSIQNVLNRMEKQNFRNDFDVLNNSQYNGESKLKDL